MIKSLMNILTINLKILKPTKRQKTPTESRATIESPEASPSSPSEKLTAFMVNTILKRPKRKPIGAESGILISPKKEKNDGEPRRTSAVAAELICISILIFGGRFLLSSINPPATRSEPPQRIAETVLSESGRQTRATIKNARKKSSPPRRGMGSVLTFLSPSGISIAPVVFERGTVAGVKI